MKKFVCLMVLALCASAEAAAADEFQNVKCGGDIAKALIGQRMSNERVVVTEKKHAALGLKHLGADEISDKLSSINYQICGSEFMLLVDRGRISDAVAFPEHSKKAPAFSGMCQLKGRDLPDVFVGVLDDATAKDPLPALTAWKIDQPHAKFIKASTDGLLCPRSGIYTVDGGL